ncbi:MAG: hypothetical protein RLZZ618_2241 [Pseudomonadota bacterium]|jgi:diguanylate cyclase (GGDEF)-like protein
MRAETDSPSPLADWLLGTDTHQRIRLVQCGVAVLLVLCSVVNMQYLVWAGIAPAVPVAWWTAVLAGGFVLFFLVIRVGRNLQFEDPSLTVPQMIFAIVCGAGGYAIAGQGRGGAFPILMVVFMFGMYSLRPEQVWRVGLLAVLLMGTTMGVMSHVDPVVYVPSVEWSHFLMIAVMVPAVAVLTGQLSRMRDRLRRQKEELATALSRIQDLATRDELTGLINRRHMVELMEQELQRGVRSGQTFCIALLSLDDWRELRAARGEAFGDQVLQAFSREALGVIRISDLLSRWNGAQFLLMLSDTRASLARLSLERLSVAIHGMQIDIVSPALHPAFSVGMTEHRAGESVAQTIERAEHALANAQAVGNKVVMG